MSYRSADDRPSLVVERLAALEPAGIRLGLGPMRRVLQCLGCLEPAIPIVHVAGTNGKGSTALLFAALAAGAGARVGLYTSPHLETPRERLRIDGQAIGERRLVEILDRVLAAAGEAGLSYFEALTAGAILWFVEEEVDLMVLEVGLGGRLDATNAVDGDMALVTPIALDHVDWLGETIEEIAGEKAGVFRHGRPVLSARGQEVAWDTLAVQARRRGTRLEEALPLPKEIRPPLAGGHQELNAELAFSAAARLPQLGLQCPMLDQVQWAWDRCAWPGRLETVELPSGVEVVLDGAHNPASALALADWLGSGSYDLLFGALDDKDVQAIAEGLAAGAVRVWLTEPPSARAAQLVILLGLGLSNISGAEQDVEAALLRALRAAEADRTPTRLVVAGSFFLVGAVRQQLSRRFGCPTPAAQTVLWRRL